MSDKRQWIPIVGLLMTMAVAVYAVVRLHAQEAAAVRGDFTNAAVAEVRDMRGQVLLRGNFVPVEEADDDIERKAALTAAGVYPAAAGEAEVEFAKTAPVDQEIEFEVKNLEPGTRVTFLIDGIEIATVTADRHGRAEFEDDIEMNPKASGQQP